jgi:hypothetical protein
MSAPRTVRRAVLQFIHVQGGIVTATIQPGKVVFTAGDAVIHAHWIEDLAELGMLEPGSGGLVPNAQPQSWRLSRAALEAISTA